MQKRSFKEIKRKIKKRFYCRVSDGIKIKKFEEVDIVPTLKCNLNCVMCHQAEIKDRKDMSFEEFKIIIDKLKKAGVTKVSLVGGEICMLKGLWKYIFELEKKGLRYDLATNAVSLNDEDIDRLKKLKNLEKVTTSLDGDKGTHNQIRRNPFAYQKTVENIRKLLKKGLRVNVGCVVQNKNFEKIVEIFNHICSLGVKDISFLFELRINSEEKKKSKEVIKKVTGKDADIFISSKKNPFGNIEKEKIREIKKKFEKIKELAKNRRVEVGLPTQLTNPEVLIDSKELGGYTCAIFKGYNFQLYNEGLLPFCPFISLGKEFNLIDKDPFGIINSKEYLRLRKYFKKFGAFSVCRKCCALEKR